MGEEKKRWIDNYDTGWIDSWQMREKKEVHPSHALEVVAREIVDELLEKAIHQERERVREILNRFRKREGKDYVANVAADIENELDLEGTD